MVLCLLTQHNLYRAVSRHLLSSPPEFLNKFENTD
jgi:hypothetical protein